MSCCNPQDRGSSDALDGSADTDSLNRGFITCLIEDRVTRSASTPPSLAEATTPSGQATAVHWTDEPITTRGTVLAFGGNNLVEFMVRGTLDSARGYLVQWHAPLNREVHAECHTISVLISRVFVYISLRNDLV